MPFSSSDVRMVNCSPGFTPSPGSGSIGDRICASSRGGWCSLQVSCLSRISSGVLDLLVLFQQLYVGRPNDGVFTSDWI
ncbi:hypothetical protein VPH35_110947 [Triticum aestivum]